ncbi:calcium-binding protein [Tabrizicola oligotrophica]|uniref:Calcium-binding protein n=1 Tax=Tabrizicola oligotrophica TaxID=2710650 RepID=A0A6M0QWY4_9RHOB|nr:calcium-binding protein [Tabrizicola oligotrophica]NEY91979.1 calcium-binding protein [Tabrizicola oligotrophica]
MATFTGTDEADTLAGGAGADTLIGGAGNDTYIVDSLGEVVVEEAGGGIDRIVASVLDGDDSYSLALWSQVEDLRYSGGQAATLLGNGAANRIEANAATSTADQLSGGAGNDSLFGFGGADMLAGGLGDDLLDGGSGADRLIGGAGNDTYVIDSAGDRVAELAGGGRDQIRSGIAFDLGQDWASEIEDLTYTGAIAAGLGGNDLDNRLTSLGAAADSLFGGAGNDTLAGGGGADTLTGGLGDDYYRIGIGDVVIEALGEGRDTYEGQRTTIASGGAATTIENLIFTGTGAATLTGNGLANLIEGGTGANTVNGGLGDDTLAGGAGADLLNGGEGNDRLFGGALPGLVLGRDRVNDSSIDQLAGGQGNDTYVVSDTQDVVIEGALEGSRDVVVSAVSNRITRYANVEALILEDGSSAYSATGGGAGDLLIGNDGDNLVSGGLGHDTLAGWGLATAAGSADILLGGAGNDVLLARSLFGSAGRVDLTVDGGTGNDLYVIGPDVALSGWDEAGTDTAIVHGSASLAQLSGIERIYLYGAAGGPEAEAHAAMIAAFAALSGGDALDLAALEAGRDVTGNALANSIFGNALGNQLSGGAGDDTIRGGNGDDTLTGGTGIDLLIGGAGNDSYHLDTGDLLSETASGGFDRLYSATLASNAAFGAYANIEGWLYTGAASVSLHRGVANLSADLLGGGSGNDTLRGYGGDDTLSGGSGNDILTGDAGNDALLGAAGDDTLSGGDDEDSLDGGLGADLLSGDLGDDRLDGGGGDDLLSGAAGVDTLAGGSGNDTLEGGENSDRLVGGAGNDVIAFGDVTVDATVSGDHLFGDDPDNPGMAGADEFRLQAIGAGSAVSETFSGSGIFRFAGGATIGDFEQGKDRIGVAASLLGNLDGAVDGSSDVVSGASTFSATDEIIFFRSDAAEAFAAAPEAFLTPINAATLTPILVSADAAIAVNVTRLLVFDDGTNSAVFLFQSANGDAAVTIDEIYLATVVTGSDALQLSDFFLF